MTTDGEIADLGNDLIAWFHERGASPQESAAACAMLLVGVMGKVNAHYYVDVAADHGREYVSGDKIPPLHRPALELLIETLEVKNKDGEGVEHHYCARLADKDVKVGPVTIRMLDLIGTGTDKQEAVDALTAQAGKACAQAYLKLLGSDKPEEFAAARSMEIGS